MHPRAQLFAAFLAIPLACSQEEPVSRSAAAPAAAEESGSPTAQVAPSATPSPAAGETESRPEPRVYYSFIDASGSVRMVDSLDAVPVALRQKAKRIEVPKTQASAGGAEGPPPTSASQPSPFARAAASSEARNAASAGSEIVIYTAKWCGWCRKALAHLDERNVSYRNRDIDEDPDAKADLRRLTGSTSIPAFEIDGEVVRGYDVALLDSLLDKRR